MHLHGRWWLLRRRLQTDFNISCLLRQDLGLVEIEVLCLEDVILQDTRFIKFKCDLGDAGFIESRQLHKLNEFSLHSNMFTRTFLVYFLEIREE